MLVAETSGITVYILILDHKLRLGKIYYTSYFLENSVKTCLFFFFFKNILIPNTNSYFIKVDTLIIRTKKELLFLLIESFGCDREYLDYYQCVLLHIWALTHTGHSLGRD